MLDPLELELQAAVTPLHECWELNPSPLEEQTVLLTTAPSLQPCPSVLYDVRKLAVLKYQP